jgi:Flp pilus assembly protein TadD
VLTMPRRLAALLSSLPLLACATSPLVHPRAAEQLQRGYAHLAAGDLERAEVAFEHALEFAPDLPEGWNGLGVVARTRGDLEVAARSFVRAVRLRPTLAEGHANLGEALLAQERFEEALDALRAALRLDPDLAAARQNLARALLQLGLLAPAERAERWAEARREYLHLLEAAPGSVTALQDLAFMDELSGRGARAETGWRQAATLAPSPEALHGLCRALVRLGRCAEALVACDRALALAPSDEAIGASRRAAGGCAE